MGHYNAELLKQPFLVLNFYPPKKDPAKSAYSIPEKVHEIFEKKMFFFSYDKMDHPKFFFQKCQAYLKLMKVASNSRCVH